MVIDHVDHHDDGDDNVDDKYIMVKCVSVCLSRKMIIVCLFVMFYGFARKFHGFLWFLVGFNGFSR